MLQVLYKLKTAKVFDRNRSKEDKGSMEVSDEDPFAIQIMAWCPESRMLCVAGVSANILIYRFSKLEVMTEVVQVGDALVVFKQKKRKEQKTTHFFPPFVHSGFSFFSLCRFTETHMCTQTTHIDTRLLSEMCLVNGSMVAMPTDGAVNKHKSYRCFNAAPMVTRALVGV